MDKTQKISNTKYKILSSGPFELSLNYICAKFNNGKTQDF
jgi:hypothetical protein